ncbi:thioesterase family protein [Oceanobacillus jeddahense]|uniref:Thioesterase family protein n=1 Tax=Oceanobacillus jeddahense TaxID=1462527 RepID=A0ABY5JM27_9BACI|nr:thioesterase family protein [Oceanobacillus jeddahense]UUI01186.1 thioesterase family protein [Oceanobacillus jeddahense]
MTESKHIWSGYVLPEWVDYNGHMNDAYYALNFSYSLDALMDKIGLDEAGRKENAYTIFTLEAHIKYVKEAHENEKLHTIVTVLDRDEKRMHLWFELKNQEDVTVATSEQMVMGIDETSGRPAPFPKAVEIEVKKLPELAKESWPAGANKPMGIRKKK